MHGILHKVTDGVRKARDSTNLAANATRAKLQEQLREHARYCDVIIQFIGAKGIPKMDMVGTADPYFIAKLDDQITMVSTVQVNTLQPVWNELWRVKNVPSSASLNVQVFDKDEGTVTDDFIGKFTTSISSGTKECELTRSFGGRTGTFWLKVSAEATFPFPLNERGKVTAEPAQSPDAPPYTFDGPVRYSVHRSPVVGHLTALNDERLYSTWKLNLKGVATFFGDVHQPWNRQYKAAQAIFQGSTSIAVRGPIQAGHRLLYARSTRNAFGVIDMPEDTFNLMRGGRAAQCRRIKPAVYTYIVSSEDDTFRFSETGAAFFVDFASKHALHSNCAETVRYSGEFHPRPAGGWASFNDNICDDAVSWELVVDNNSGTYAPDKTMLSVVKVLLEYNFPGFTIHALDREDPALSTSREDCRAYALRNRGVTQSELEPTQRDGEETLSHKATLSIRKPDLSTTALSPEA